MNYSKLVNNIDSWSSTRLIIIRVTLTKEDAICKGMGLSAEARLAVVHEFERKKLGWSCFSCYSHTCLSSNV